MDIRISAPIRKQRGVPGRAIAVGIGVALVAPALAGCGSAGADDAPVERKTFALTGKTLTIDAANSTVTLVPADVREVEVERQVGGWVVLGSGPDPVWKMENDTLTLRVKCDAMISNCAARHEVKVPRGVTVAADAGNGRVTADGFDTPLRLSADNGDIVVRDSGGPLDLKSGNGSVLAERIGTRSVVARADNGEIRLGFSGVPDLVDTVSNNGSIVIDLPQGGEKYAVTAGADNGEVSVDVPRSESSAHVVKARSDNGEVKVRTAN
ncbi:DUF4097 family beta strand repeat protein [Streptomyces sp. SID8356]|uniref:DUF4097 family beta strand repeat-containing protein n=1 Tax=unclassified Streptomyces TaxID=2593676 RepID=UPI000380924D|nr:DUF4097 family beta strand repeat-containing protein [Streptomyces sp. CcalMP-8W]MYT36505.1 DUF4097 family beta strand repeat protein [Streptomyces sp. SID8356]